MAADLTEWIAALRASHDRLAALVAGASEDDLRRTSMADAWSVAQVLSHLGSGAVILLGGLTGNEVDPPQVWADWNAKPPADMAVGYVEADEALVRWWETRTPEELAAVSVPVSFQPEPADAPTALGMRLNEVGLHEWDAVAAFDRAAVLGPEATPLLLHRLPLLVTMLARFLPRESRPASETTVAVHTTDPTRDLTLVLGSTMVLTPEAPARADATLDLPAEALLRLTAGRLKTGDSGASASGALSLDDLRRAFPGF